MPRLPKTRSGKILRGSIMKKIADGEAWKIPATIGDPKVLEEIGEAVKGRGLAEPRLADLTSGKQDSRTIVPL